MGRTNISINAPNPGLNRKLNWNTFTCGAVLEIMPKIMSCPNEAMRMGAAICKPTYKTFAVIAIKYSGEASRFISNEVIKTPHSSKDFSIALISQYIPPIFMYITAASRLKKADSNEPCVLVLWSNITAEDSPICIFIISPPAEIAENIADAIKPK